MGFLKLVPMRVWGYVLAATLAITVVGLSYKKGFSAGADKQQLKQQKLIDKRVAEALDQAEEDLEEALQLQQVKRLQVLTLNQQLDVSKGRSAELQATLDEIFNTPPSACDELPDDYYRLRKQLYNKRPQG